MPNPSWGTKPARQKAPDPAVADRFVAEQPDISGAEKRLTLRIPEDLHTRVKIKAAKDRVVINDIGTKLFEAWEAGRINLD
jgi:predicted regulator of Ras-like GTPase activity (Roadblock/LC7/MglB family)